MNNSLTIVLGVLLLMTGCGSSGPKTQFYSLFPNVEPDAATVISGEQLSFGIGPVVLPEYLDNTALVSRSSAQQLQVSGVHAWGGDLSSTVSRVMAANLATLWQQDAVWAFPWDTRARPIYQVRIVFEEFSGERGGEAVLKARWVLFGDGGKQEISVGSSQFSEQTQDNSPQAYVAALNLLLKNFCNDLAVKIKKTISK
ncbi:hypothetical protein P886_1869 [Alteromonadaceae bacterium 2753L.S.0a.02]|nr:hypothetical protein P886_1869 [Alteromonadaceae bacterium 2753L.S.0a.02]